MTDFRLVDVQDCLTGMPQRCIMCRIMLPIGTRHFRRTWRRTAENSSFFCDAMCQWCWDNKIYGIIADLLGMEHDVLISADAVRRTLCDWMATQRDDPDHAAMAAEFSRRHTEGLLSLAHSGRHMEVDCRHAAACQGMRDTMVRVSAMMRETLDTQRISADHDAVSAMMRGTLR